METLSDKVRGCLGTVNYYVEDDVKEFIKKLKAETEWTQTKGSTLGMITEEQIDKLAGDKLI